MERGASSKTEDIRDEEFQGSNVSRVRSDGSGLERAHGRGVVGDDESGSQGSSLPSAAEIEEQKRAQEQIWQDATYRSFGRRARTVTAAQHFAEFDPGKSELQRAEFYVIDDPEINTYGYF